jgi:glycerol-3-phosphate cytidylyltransferase
MVDEIQEPETGQQPRRVLTYGTFDVLHWGHVNLLLRAKELAYGGELIVALSSDAFDKLKGKQAYHDYETRFKMVSSIRFVDRIIPERTWEQKLDDVRELEVDCVVMGDDWEGDPRFSVLLGQCDLVFLPRTKAISSTRIREIILAEGSSSALADDGELSSLDTAGDGMALSHDMSGVGVVPSRDTADDGMV